MVDYVPAAQIEYIDVLPCEAGESSFSSVVYPEHISSNIFSSFDNSVASSFFVIECPYAELPDKNLPLSQGSGILVQYYTYYWVLPVTDSDGNVYSPRPNSALYRTFDHNINPNSGLPYTLDFVSPGYYIESVDVMPSVDNSSGVFWLYNFGHKIYDASISIDAILGFGVGDYNFFYFLLSSGFLVYMGIVVVKWFIP